MARYSDSEIKDIFAANLTSIMEEMDIDGAELARRIGKEKQSVYAWLKKRSFPSTASLQLLVDALNVTTDDLLTKEGSEFADGYIRVSLYGKIAAGTPIEMLEVDDEFPIPAEMASRYPDAFLLKVAGESMNLKIPNGAYALVSPTSEVIDGQPYAVCVNGDEATIKRVRKLHNGFELIPESTDPTFEVKTYNYNEPGTETITVIGRVVYYVLPYDWSF